MPCSVQSFLLRRRRSMLVHGLVVLGCVCGSGRPVNAAESVRASVAVRTNVSSRTSLNVSEDVLRFEVAGPEQPALASLDFVAGARTYTGGEVMLSIEPVSPADLEGADGLSGVRLTFAGDGPGVGSGALTSSESSVAGRWSGSGLRHGRLVFALHGAPPGVYTMRVRLALTTP